jgi:hypothetical protein
MRRGQDVPGGFRIAQRPVPWAAPRKLTGKFRKQATAAVSRASKKKLSSANRLAAAAN